MGFGKAGLLVRIWRAKHEIEVSKQWFLSRTIWINLITLILDAADMLGGIQVSASGTEIDNIAVAAIAVINIYLRFATTTAVTVKKPADQKQMKG